MLSASDLWVVPPSNNSAWFARLDWYLNWQMSRGLAHRPARPSAEVERLAAEYDIPIPFAQTAEKGPLMIACEGLLPSAKCIVLPFSGDLDAWFGTIAKCAADLGAKTLSIFLPSGINVDTAHSHWKQSGVEARFILDQESK